MSCIFCLDHKLLCNRNADCDCLKCVVGKMPSNEWAKHWSNCPDNHDILAERLQTVGILTKLSPIADEDHIKANVNETNKESTKINCNKNDDDTTRTNCNNNNNFNEKKTLQMEAEKKSDVNKMSGIFCLNETPCNRNAKCNCFKCFIDKIPLPRWGLTGRLEYSELEKEVIDHHWSQVGPDIEKMSPETFIEYIKHLEHVDLTCNNDDVNGAKIAQMEAENESGKVESVGISARTETKKETEEEGDINNEIEGNISDEHSRTAFAFKRKLNDNEKAKRQRLTVDKKTIVLAEDESGSGYMATGKVESVQISTRTEAKKETEVKRNIINKVKGVTIDSVRSVSLTCKANQFVKERVRKKTPRNGFANLKSIRIDNGNFQIHSLEVLRAVFNAKNLARENASFNGSEKFNQTVKTVIRFNSTFSYLEFNQKLANKTLFSAIKWPESIDLTQSDTTFFDFCVRDCLMLRLWFSSTSEFFDFNGILGRLMSKESDTVDLTFE